MIIVFTGDNTFAIRDAVDAQIRADREKLGADAITIADAAQLEINDLPQLLLGATLFASERLVVLRDAASAKAVWEKLADLLPELPDTTTVLLIAPSVDKRTRTYKWLQKHAAIRENKILNEMQLAEWVQNEARQHGMDIEPSVARYLVHYVGTDQWRLQQDLEKLALTHQTPTIDRIREFIEPNPQSTVFELLDAVFAGNQQQVDASLQIMRGSEDPYRFFGLLSNQVYALLLSATADGRDAATIARDAGMHPFVVRKLQPIAQKLPAAKQQAIIDTLADLDRQMKSTGADPWTLIRVALKSVATT